MTDVSMTLVEDCQVCGSRDLTLALSLGFVPPVNEVHRPRTAGSGQVAYPLDLLRCPVCHLVQLGVELPARVLFPAEYPYRSGTTKILRDNFADLARETEAVLGDAKGSLVVDIGSNDGTLLEAFRQRGFRVHGVEPTGAAADAMARGIDTTEAYFDIEVARALRGRLGAARVVTAANVFAHMAKIDLVVDAIAALLDRDGIFVSESHYLGDLVETVQVDTVYHEHLRYYSLHSLMTLLARHGFEPFQVQRIPTHGGSIRVYAAAAGGRPVEPSVPALLAEERASGIIDGSALRTLAERAARARRRLPRLLGDLVTAGKRVYGIGAPSRASTLINFTGIDVDLLETVLEVPDSPKIGGLIPGTRIPIEHERRLFDDPPDYALLLSWHIADELIPKLRSKGFAGGFVIPLPEPRVVTGDMVGS